MDRTAAEQLEHTVNTVRAALASESELSTVILYGSAASGTLRTGGELESDVDIAVAGAAPLETERILALKSRLSLATGCEVDLVDLRCLHGLILEQVLARGRILRKDDADFLAEKTLEMFDYQTFFAPILRSARSLRIRTFTSSEGEPARRSHGS